MIKDHSLQEIDILKLIMFVLAFIFVLVCMITFFIIPSIKEYKIAKVENQTSVMNLLRIEEVYASYVSAFNEFEANNNRTLRAIRTTFNEKDFLKNASNFFDNASLARLSSKDNNASFLHYELNVTGKLNSPQKFYDFIDFLNNYNSIILLDFPVKMQAHNDLIDTSFEIKVLESKVKVQRVF